MLDNKFYMSMNISKTQRRETALPIKPIDKSEDKKSMLQMSCLLKNDTKTKLDDQFNVINRIATDKSLMVKSIAMNNRSYLMPRKIKIINEETFLTQCVTQMTQEHLDSLKREIDACFLSNKACDDKVLFNTIGMINLYENQNTKFIWRRVKGDGNCFYRAVIFSLLEHIILNNQKQELMNLIDDFRTISRNEKFIKLASDLKLDSEHCLNLLIMLYFSLNSRSRDPIKKSYITFLKIMNNYRNLDYCLVCYYHIVIYEYLRENQTKLYSEEFSVFIGNMLPLQYEDDEGNVNWDQFYQDFLFKFYQEAEKIVIYLTPYLFDVSLEVMYYDEEKNERNVIRFSSSKYSKGQKVISTLYKKVHYDIIYKEDMFNKFEQHLSINFYSIKNNQNCINCQGRGKLYQIERALLCEACLTAEIKSVILTIFLFYIQNNQKFYLQKFEPISNFKTYIINLNSFVKFSIEEGLSILKNGTTFEKIVNELKETICITCYQPSKSGDNSLKLPCNCCFCSPKCLKTYHNLIEPISITKNAYICLCNTQYSFQQIMEAIELFDSYKYKSSDLMRLFQYKTYRHCFICLEPIPYIKDGIIKISYVKNKKLEMNYKLFHVICYKCSVIIGAQTRVYCKLCNDDTDIMSSKHIRDLDDNREIE